MKKTIKETTLADRILFFFLVAASFSGIFLAREAMPESADVFIEVDGKPAYTYPVGVDRTVKVPGPFGETSIEIRDRKVRVKEAHCPNRLCEKEGWISRGVIVCIPNRLMIFIRSVKEKPKELDAVTG